MSAPADTLALGFDLRAERRRRLRRSARIAGPIVTLLILLASVAGIGAFLHQANRADARLLTEDLLAELERRVVREVVEFLEPAADMVRLAEVALVDWPPEEQRRRAMQQSTARILNNDPQLVTFSLTDAQGNFTMLSKMPDGSVHVKLMDRRADQVDSRWIRRDADGAILRVEPVEADTFDPRTRPWFKGAAETRQLYWSDVYLFFTSQTPGITVSLPVFDDTGGLANVYAVDIGLHHLSTFFAGLEIGHRGRAMIIEADGLLVAYPVLDQMVKKTDDGLARVHIEDLADPVLNRAYDRFRIDGPGKRELVVQGDGYINTAVSLKTVLGRDWTLLIVAPEDDFVGFVTENNRRGMYMSVAVLALGSLLAGLLVFQGLRADRNAQLVFERQQQLAAQSRTFSELAARAALFDSDDESAVSALTETVAKTVEVRRISIWHLTRDGQAIVCEDSFDKGASGHTGGMELGADELPELFQLVSQGEEIVAVDAATDPRTADLHRIYLGPLGCRSLASVPIVCGEQIVGMIWLEDDSDRIGSDSEDLGFARAVATLLALRMRGGETTGRRSGAPRRSEGEHHGALAEPMRGTELVSAGRAQSLLARIARERDEGTGIGAQVFEDVTVVVMRFADPVSLAASVDESGREAVDDLARKLETLAEELGVEYLKLLGNQIVCAAGFAGDSQRAAEAMAEFALAGLDHCARLFTRLERPLELQIGIDSGPAIGSAVGGERSIFNLWGEAVATATRMAETGVYGMIQATESSYRRLREDYLFRVRGSYYLEGFGEFTTYALTGRF